MWLSRLVVLTAGARRFRSEGGGCACVAEPLCVRWLSHWRWSRSRPGAGRVAPARARPGRARCLFEPGVAVGARDERFDGQRDQAALAQAGGKAGQFTVNDVALDDSRTTVQTAANAHRVASDPAAVYDIGGLSSAVSEISIPNRAGVPQISPSASYDGLTTHDAATLLGEPTRVARHFLAAYRAKYGASSRTPTRSMGMRRRSSRWTHGFDRNGDTTLKTLGSTAYLRKLACPRSSRTLCHG